MRPNPNQPHHHANCSSLRYQDFSLSRNQWQFKTPSPHNMTHDTSSAGALDRAHHMARYQLPRHRRMRRRHLVLTIHGTRASSGRQARSTAPRSRPAPPASPSACGFATAVRAPNIRRSLALVQTSNNHPRTHKRATRRRRTTGASFGPPILSHTATTLFVTEFKYTAHFWRDSKFAVHSRDSKFTVHLDSVNF